MSEVKCIIVKYVMYNISEKFEDIGCSTFYMFIDMVSDSVRQFPPTMQFFSTCVELLGKVCIPYHTIPYHTIPYHTIPYHTIPYHTIPYHTIPYHTIPYHTILYNAYFFIIRPLSWRTVPKQKFCYEQYWLILKSWDYYYQYFNQVLVKIVL